MPNGPKCYLVLDTGNHDSPSMTLGFIKTSPFKYLKRSNDPALLTKNAPLKCFHILGEVKPKPLFRTEI